MEFQIFELRQERDRERVLSRPVDYSQLKPIPPRHPSFAASGLIHLRPWIHVGLNEGSFLKAYGTYEFFERGPPSIVYSLKQCLAPIDSPRNPFIGIRALPALRSFTYTAIFPFSNHAVLHDLIQYVEILDVQFAPDPRSNILDDKARTGKAELEDCWAELFALYSHLASTLCTHDMWASDFPQFRKLNCRDSRIPALRPELDEIFTPLCLPTWVEFQPGEFTRQLV